MSKMQRTNVYADPEDLAQIKENAQKLGVSEAELIRRGIKLAAMSTRVWDEPLDFPEFDSDGSPLTSEAVHQAVVGGATR
ncbi:ribbon-helix-helix protein, CopG family [Nonomuraea polychroma]|uniref:Ribbon-helix-helix CopG family protein n=1 Tax=Nonomuraea polychroma TaxID=46176 RepID=A0A438MD69_9ACTN|nr:ribbon-helix-helix protein, CopG family [Nonomuraea polychroma]RVX43495.1 ribbon-helix-helix CopG family protein [Nonomuraea polychroma]